MNDENKGPARLVDGEGLLEALFDEKSRPSISWLGTLRAARKIPFIKLGRKVFYDVEQVRAAIQARNTIQLRKPL
jgi:hypothetical protein